MNRPLDKNQAAQTADKVHSERSELFFCTKAKKNGIIEAEKG